MEIFIFLYFLLFILWGTTASRDNRLSRNSVWVLGMLIMWLIPALRDTTIGTDLEIYIPMYDNVNLTSSYDYMEPGYLAYCKALSYLHVGHAAFLAITAFICIFPITYVIKRYSPDIAFSYIIYVSFILYHFAFSGLRQAMALGIISLSYIYIEKRRFIPFLLLTGLAICFHYSAILFLVAYPFCNLFKATNTRYLLISIAAVVVIASLYSILTIVVPIIFGEGKYSSYMDTDVVPSYNLLLLIFAMFLFTFTVRHPSRSIQNLRKLIYLGALAQSMGLVSEAGARIAFYFFLFIPLALPQAISEWHRGKMEKRMAKFGIAAMMCAFFFYANASGYLDVIPYKFNWE